MVASVWLEYVANQAVTAPLALIITQVEAPKCGDLTWITIHSFEETPCEHQKEYIVKYHKHTILPTRIR
jgi:hypothetical protein